MLIMHIKKAHPTLKVIQEPIGVDVRCLRTGLRIEKFNAERKEAEATVLECGGVSKLSLLQHMLKFTGSVDRGGWCSSRKITGQESRE